ncbi:10438_t:CDS:1, partial [Dentiscutata heterogama]
SKKMDDQTSNIVISISQNENRLQKIKKLLREYLLNDFSKNIVELSSLLDEVQETKIWQHAGYENFYKFCQDIIGQDIINLLKK